MSRVRHIYAKKGEYIKVHRGSSNNGCGCFAFIVILVILIMILG